jgi:UDP-glucose 4-epimerase
MKAIVTGGAGFIGSHLVDELLLQGAEVTVIDDLSSGRLTNLDNARKNFPTRFSLVTLDVADKETEELIKKVQPDYVFHLAAQSSVVKSLQDPIKDAQSNVLGSLRVFQGASKACVKKLIYAASGGTLYGKVESAKLPVKETEFGIPVSPYGVSKKTPIDYLFFYKETYNLGFCALAIANAYGPRQDPNGEAGVVSIFAYNLLKNNPVTIFGDGNQTRDFIYVKDVVNSFLLAASSDVDGSVVNIATGKETSINELYYLIAGILDFSLKPIYAEARKGELYRIALDPVRASLKLGFRAQTPLELGIANTLKYIKENELS